MRRLWWVPLAVLLMGAAPSRTQTYTAGETIKNEEVTENEDNIFSYLQAGVDTIRNNAVESADIQDGAVTAAKLGTGAVTTTVILDGTVAAADIATDAVGADEIAADAVGASEIAAGAVGTSEIATDGVDSAEIAANAVGASEIATDSVTLTTDTVGNYAATIADAGNSTITVTNGSAEGGAVTLDAVDVNCSNCIDGTDIAVGSDAQGDVLYYNGTDWVRLGAGTSGYFLKTQGAAANPIWASNASTTVLSGSTTVASIDTSFWMEPGGNLNGTETVADQWRAPLAMTCSNLHAEVGNDVAGGNSFTVSLNINGTASSVQTCSITAKACSDLTGTVAVAENDTLNIEFLDSGGAVAQTSAAFSLSCTIP